MSLIMLRRVLLAGVFCTQSVISLSLSSVALAQTTGSIIGQNAGMIEQQVKAREETSNDLSFPPAVKKTQFRQNLGPTTPPPSSYVMQNPAPQTSVVTAPAATQAPRMQTMQAYAPAPQASAPIAPAPVSQPAAAAPATRNNAEHVAMIHPDSQPSRPMPAINPRFQRQEVDYKTKEPEGTIIIDTTNHFLYLTLGDDRALRYGVGVGRAGFEWKGSEKITRKAEWPDWYPPKEMLLRRADLPERMEGGPHNPLGARAMYLGATLYRIHGTNEPWTIGLSMSSGCIRMMNDDVIDLYNRVPIGTRVIVM
jgi:lipoprotein-anchoring transpeptidase ErfK/SrfK